MVSTDSFTADDLQRLHSSLSGLVTYYDSIGSAATSSDDDSLVPGSSAQGDVAAGVPVELVHELLVSVNLKVAVALELNDMLASLAAAAARGDPSPYFVPFSISRSAIEATTMACWLLESDIDPKSRAARQLSVEWQETLSQEKLGADDLAAVKSEILTQAEGRGLELVGGGVRAGFGQGFPTRTELTADQLGPEVYRILSAASHGETWAAYIIGFTPTEIQTGWGRIAQKAQPVAVYMLPILWAFRSLARCLWLDVKYRGGDLTATEHLLEATFESAGISAQHCFWRGA